MSRRDVGRLLAGQFVHGLGVLSAASVSLSAAATDSLASLRAAPSSLDRDRAIHGRGKDRSMWVRARVADPAAAPVVEIPDGTALLRVLRERNAGAGPILAPLTAGALAGTARAVAAMESEARTNALAAIADLIRRARPQSGAVRAAVARSAAIVGSGESGANIAASLDRLSDELVADLSDGAKRLAAPLSAVASTSVFLAGSWSRQSLGDPWLVADLLGNPERTVVVARGGVTGEGDLVAGWLDPPLRNRLELIEDAGVAAALRAWRCEAVLLLAEDVRPDGTVAAALGSLAVALVAQHCGVPVFGVDLPSAFTAGRVDRHQDGAGLSVTNGGDVDLVPRTLITKTITARSI